MQYPPHPAASCWRGHSKTKENFHVQDRSISADMLVPPGPTLRNRNTGRHSRKRSFGWISRRTESKTRAGPAPLAAPREDLLPHRRMSKLPRLPPRLDLSEVPMFPPISDLCPWTLGEEFPDDRDRRRCYNRPPTTHHRRGYHKDPFQRVPCSAFWEVVMYSRGPTDQSFWMGIGAGDNRASARECMQRNRIFETNLVAGCARKGRNSRRTVEARLTCSLDIDSAKRRMVAMGIRLEGSCWRIHREILR